MKLNRNKALAMVASFLILSVAMGIGVWSMGFPATVTVRPESMIKNSSFNVGFDGTYYYAVNGSTGEMLLNNTNKATVINACISNLTASGGTIYLNQLALGTVASYGANILIISDIQGYLIYFSNNKMIYSTSDGILDLGIWTNLNSKGYFWNYLNRTDTFAYPIAPYSFEIFTDGVTTFMKNGSDGQIPYQNTNSSKVFDMAIGNSSAGDSIFIKTGTYGPIYLNKDVSLIGEGLSTTPAAYPLDPDDMITGMTGVVIGITTASTNAITIAGTRGNIHIENIGIHFAGSGNGIGVYSPAAHDQSGLMYCTMKNVIVWGHDANHYAFYLVNFQHCEFDMLLSYGGPAFHLETDDSRTYGISHFGITFARVPSTIATMTHNVYEIIGSVPVGQNIGGIKFDRVHIMDNSVSNTASSLYIFAGLVIDIRECDIENPTKKMVTMVNCSNINIYHSFMFGGGISHTGCSFCGYLYGYIDPTWGGVNYGALTDSGSDFIGSEVGVVARANVTFSRTSRQPCSFEMFKLDSTYYAREGALGQNYVWSSNFTYVFESVIAAMNASGGLIVFQPANYSISSTLLINKTGITIQGLTPSEGAVGIFLASGVNVPLFNITADYVTFRDITLYGNFASSTDTVVITGGHGLFERVTFQFSARDLVSMAGGDDNAFRDCVFANNNRYGVIANGSTYATFDNCQFRTIGAISGLTDVAGIAFDGSSIGCSVINSKFNFINSEVGGVHYGYGIEELSASISQNKYIGDSGYGCARGLFSPIISSNLVTSGNSYTHIGGMDSNEPATMTIDSAVSSYSYLVFTDGSTYFMRNGSTGRVDFSSTNASAVVNNAIGNSTNGDSMQVKGSTFSLDSSLVVPWSNFTIDFNNALLSMTTEKTAIIINGTSLNHLRNVLISNVRIKGLETGYNYDGIYVNCSDYVTIEHSTIECVGIYDPAIASENGIVFGPGCQDCLAFDCTTYKCGTNGILMSGSSSDPVLRCKAIACKSYGNASATGGGCNGYSFSGNTQDCKYIDCDAFNLSDAGFKMESFSGGTIAPNRCTFQGGTISNVGLSDVYAARLGDNSNPISNCQVVGTTFIDTYTGGISVTGENNTLKDLKFHNIGLTHPSGGRQVINIKGNYTDVSDIRIDADTGQTNNNRALLIEDPSYYTSVTNLRSSQCRYGGIAYAGTNTVLFNDVFNGEKTENSGSMGSCVNGTWIATGLAGQANGAYSLKVNGTVIINSTAYVLEPTIIAENSTHVQIQFLYYYIGAVGADSVNAVTATETRTIMWYFEYKP